MRFVKATGELTPWTVAVAMPFALPLLLDALRGPQSNLAIILGFIGEGGPKLTWTVPVFYVLSLWPSGPRQARRSRSRRPTASRS